MTCGTIGAGAFGSKYEPARSSADYMALLGSAGIPRRRHWRPCCTHLDSSLLTPHFLTPFSLLTPSGLLLMPCSFLSSPQAPSSTTSSS